jgi:hypothetical protein
MGLKNEEGAYMPKGARHTHLPITSRATWLERNGPTEVTVGVIFLLPLRLSQQLRIITTNGCDALPLLHRKRCVRPRSYPFIPTTRGQMALPTAKWLRTLVQLARVPYNSSILRRKEGRTAELIQGALCARSPPKRKKPTGPNPLVAFREHIPCAGSCRSNLYQSVRSLSRSLFSSTL